MEVVLGKMYKDRITGFKGIAVANYSYIEGCDRVDIQPPHLDTTGNILESKVFDSPRLIEVIDQYPVMVPIDEGDKPGGYRPSPPSR